MLNYDVDEDRQLGDNSCDESACSKIRFGEFKFHESVLDLKSKVGKKLEFIVKILLIDLCFFFKIVYNYARSNTNEMSDEKNV